MNACTNICNARPGGGEIMATIKAALNLAQREALAHWMEQGTQGVPIEGEEYPVQDPIEFGEENGQFTLNGVFLHSDGEWATFPEAAQATTYTLGGTGVTIETTLPKEQLQEMLWDKFRELENDSTVPNVQIEEFDLIEHERMVA
jgi:hypothetical protein